MVFRMKSAFAMCVLMCVCSFKNVYSQSKITDVIEVKDGVTFEDDNKKLAKIVGEFENKVYGVGFKGTKKIYFNVFDKTQMNLLKSTEIELPDYEKREVVFDDVILMQDKIYVLASSYNKKTDVAYVLAYNINLEGNLNPTPTVISESLVDKKLSNNIYNFKLNKSKDRLLIIYAEDYDKDKTVNYHCQILDKELKSQFSFKEHFQLDNKSKDYTFNLVDFAMNQNEDVFLMQVENFKKDNDRTTSIKLHVFKKDLNYSKNTIAVEENGLYVSSGFIVPTDKDQVKIFGLYTEISEKGKIKNNLIGNFIIPIDTKQLKAAKTILLPLDKAAKIKLIGEEAVEKNKDVPAFYSVSDVLVTPSKEIIVTYEATGLMEVRDAKARILGYNLINGNLMVVNFTPENQIKWFNVISKSQFLSNTVTGLKTDFPFKNFKLNFSDIYTLSCMTVGVEKLGSYNFMNSSGQFCVVFNEKPNFKENKVKFVSSFSSINDYVTYLYVINPDGTLLKMEREEAKKTTPVLSPRIFYKLNDNAFLMSTKSNKKDKLSTITIK